MQDDICAAKGKLSYLVSVSIVRPSFCPSICDVLISIRQVNTKARLINSRHIAIWRGLLFAQIP